MRPLPVAELLFLSLEMVGITVLTYILEACFGMTPASLICIPIGIWLGWNYRDHLKKLRSKC